MHAEHAALVRRPRGALDGAHQLAHVLLVHRPRHDARRAVHVPAHVRQLLLQSALRAHLFPITRSAVLREGARLEHRTHLPCAQRPLPPFVGYLSQLRLRLAVHAARTARGSRARRLLRQRALSLPRPLGAEPRSRPQSPAAELPAGSLVRRANAVMTTRGPRRAVASARVARRDQGGNRGRACVRRVRGAAEAGKRRGPSNCERAGVAATRRRGRGRSQRGRCEGGVRGNGRRTPRRRWLGCATNRSSRPGLAATSARAAALEAEEAEVAARGSSCGGGRLGATGRDARASTSTRPPAP